MKVFIFIFVYLLFFSCLFTLDVYIEPEESSKIIGRLECNLIFEFSINFTFTY